MTALLKQRLMKWGLSMSDRVKYQGPSATAAAIGIAAILAAGGQPIRPQSETLAYAGGQPIWPQSETPAYITTHSPSTSGFVEQSLALEMQPAAHNFGEAIATFYATLLEDQEPLGAEFEAIWDANAAELYES